MKQTLDPALLAKRKQAIALEEKRKQQKQAKRHAKRPLKWCARRDSNPRHLGSKPSTLSS